MNSREEWDSALAQSTVCNYDDYKYFMQKIYWQTSTGPVIPSTISCSLIKGR